MSGTRNFFYEGGGRRSAVDALFEEIHRPEAVVCLLGDEGSGRTEVLERFCAEVDPDVLSVAVVTGDILMSATQCLAVLAQALPPSSMTHDVPEDAAAAVIRIRESGRSPVLVVDDAHELGERPRSDILEFCRYNVVPLVLAGDAQLLGREVPEELITGRIALRAFSENETEDFVAGWLAVGDEDELPSHRTIERLHRQSHGLPGKLVTLLESGAARRNTWFPVGLPLWHVVFTIGAALLLLLLLLRFAPEPTTAVAQDAGEIAVLLPTPAASAPSLTPPETRASSVAIPRPLEITPLSTVGTGEASTPAPAVAGQAAIPIALPPPAAAPVATPGKPPVAARRYSADEEALLKERASRFTLQLFASFNEQAVRQFETKHRDVDIRVFRTSREELPWYVAVTGVYPGKDAAKAGVAQLPADIRKLEPWARSLQGIQDELRRRRD